MNKKKIKLIIILSIVLIALIIGILLYSTLPYKISKTTKTNLTYDKDNSYIYVNDNSLKILQITDLHVNGALDQPMIFFTIKQLVKKVEPDLIVVTGDIFSNGCKEKDVELFINFMENLQLPWASILGNHDDESPYSLFDLSQILENANDSLFKTGNVLNMYGNYDYIVKFQNEKLFQLIFMDSRNSGFTKDSKEYYINTINKTKEINNGSLLNNLLFFHIPLIEINDAVNEYNNNQNIGIGKIREKTCPQENDVDFFETILELNTTKALIFGHDHINNTKIKYKGIDFCYGLKTGPSSYNGLRLVGGTVYTLNSDGTYEIEDKIIF